MIVVLHAHGLPQAISTRDLGKRFESYVKQYKDTMDLKNSEAGLNSAEVCV